MGKTEHAVAVRVVEKQMLRTVEVRRLGGVKVVKVRALRLAHPKSRRFEECGVAARVLP
jgi:hypothetical protein